ncbi:pancreatic lipase-related protein 2 [Strongylocentrotus purpuratus]|uniref:Lipase domain-containing protein n=1 Tax=Strongylocentrotus purpuratus TaxID=7668 RepID=A0A7M7RGA4_STRPU|nr:pancreatic lipase-related protein 2 [Strongylocentrotus purpuratus]|eukprot:XP_789118.3 PREDICTED: pancreatic lipase-related protein 2 [Strongylocentrotus purpuratus]
MKVLTSTIFIAFLCFLLEKGQAAEICYGDLGCFEDAGCHGNVFPPESPEFINTRFYLFTRRTWNFSQELIRDDVDRLRASNFDPKVPTMFSIHGWNSNGFGSGERDRKNAFLEDANVNVITVDWRRGASGIVYPKQHQNTRVVGREIALFARFLNLETGMYFKDVHLVGHSLGAHTAGYAGAYQKGFGRITGSDPAGPFFRDDEPECRLDPTDALFVDVIHGDGNDNIGLGTSLPMGHQDFYPNGGRHQPACQYGSDLGGCSHAYSSRYFAESLRSTTCKFKAYPCPSWAAYMSGLCRSCGVGGCSEMGYHAIDHKDLRGLFFLDTNPESPYCIPEPWD